METLIKILVLEDEMIIGAKISMQLTNLGYEVTGILPRGEEAVQHVRENKPDLVLLDTRSVGDVILDLPTRLMVLKRGKIVATSTCQRSLVF